MPSKTNSPLKVFIGCPGDMAPERAALLSLRDHLDELGCPVRFLIWKNATPGAGDAQKVIFDHYPIADWDIFIGLLWTRFGVPSGIVDPLSGETLTGTEAEFAGAYDAFLASGGKRPQILLYRCARDLPIDFDMDQFAGVRKFFKQTATGAQRPALSQDFKTAEELKQRVTQDIVKVAVGLRKAAKKSAISGAKVVRVGKKEPDWAAAEESYRHYLINSQKMITCHTAESGRQRVEVELERVFIKLTATLRVDSDLRDRELDRIENQILNEEDRNSLHRMDSGKDLPGFNQRWTVLKDAKDRLVFSILPVSAAPPPIALPDLLAQHAHLALTGLPGSGKSTLLQYLLLTYACGKQSERLYRFGPRLPVLIRLHQFHRWVEQRRHEKKLGDLKPAHFAQFLANHWHDETGAPELPPSFFERILCVKTNTGPSSSRHEAAAARHRPGDRALILLDGLDEIADPAQRRAIAALVATALDDWRDARVILTSRPKAWESEGRAAFGSRVGEARICDLDDGQIEEFVRHWYLASTIVARGDSASARGHAESRAVDLIGAVKPERIRKLAATPLMLSILAMVHSRGVGLPQERSQLYHECIEFMLGYWDEIVGFDPDPELHEVARHDRQTKRQLLEPVALWMHRLGSEQIEPGERDLEDQFTARFQSVLNEPPDCARRHARAFLRLIVERGGLMQESEAGRFRFVHLTFQEYLAASEIAQGEAPFAQVERHLHDPWWREVILLCGGELSRAKTHQKRANTTAWLRGIRNAGTWSEDVLSRDLELAFRSLSDMAPTGVDPILATDLAKSVVHQLTRREVTIWSLGLRDMLENLGNNHAAQAIAEVLSEQVSVSNETMLFYLFSVASELSPSALNGPLKVAFATAHGARDANLRYHGAYLSLLHGPVKTRADSFVVFREAFVALGLTLDGDLASSIFALQDETINELAREWWRHLISGNRSFDRKRAIEVLIRHGTEEDKARMMTILCQDFAEKRGDICTDAASLLETLGTLADVPVCHALFSDLFAGKKRTVREEDIEAWGKIVAHRSAEVDWTPVRRLMKSTDFRVSLAAAKVLLKQGGEADRSNARAFLMGGINGADLGTARSFSVALIESDPALDRATITPRFAELVSDLKKGEGRWVVSSVVNLGREAWKFPVLIQAVISDADSDHEYAYRSLENLIALLRVKPDGVSISHPSPSDIARKVRNWLKMASSSPLKGIAPWFMAQLSTFPELRGRAVASRKVSRRDKRD